MLIYFIMLALITFMAFTIYIPNFERELKDKLFLSVSFLILTAVSAFRGIDVGTDTKNYMDIFRRYVLNVSDPHSEPGFALLNQLISYITDSPQSIIIVSSILINLGFMHFIYHNSKNAWLSVYIYITLFYYFFSFNLVRQFIAISVVLFAWNSLKQGKIIRFILLVLLASTFHTTALISLLLIFVYLGRKNTKLIPFIMLATAIAIFGTNTFMNFIVTLFPRYITYIESSDQSTGGIMPIFLYFMIFIALYLTREKKNQEHNVMLSIAAITAALSVLNYFHFLFYRPAFFFNVFAIILIPFIATRFKGKEHPIAIYIICSLGMLYFIYYMVLGWHDVTPYTFFWQS